MDEIVVRIKRWMGQEISFKLESRREYMDLLSGETEFGIYSHGIFGFENKNKFLLNTYLFLSGKKKFTETSVITREFREYIRD